MRLLPFQQNKKKLEREGIRTFVKIGPECFDSIYLGVRIEDEKKHDIIKLAKNLNLDIKICQMETDPHEFKLVSKANNMDTPQ